MSTIVCVPIVVEDEARALAQADEARLAGADMVEWRVDAFYTGAPEEISAIERIVRESPLPCILTCRSETEGGHGEADDQARADLVRSALAWKRPPRYIDIELRHFGAGSPLRSAWSERNRPEDDAPGLVLSTHDFSGRPADLSRRLLAMRAESACRVLKVAFAAKSSRDNLEVFELLRERDRPMIALAMGEAGIASRVLAPKCGGFLTFAALRKQETTAPGQPTVSDLLSIYRIREISASTRVYGVIGYPIGHSLSPVLHNAGFERNGIDAVYVPLSTPASEDDPEGSYASLKATVLALLADPTLDFGGASVTMPHKEGLVKLAHAEGWGMDEASAATGAANTLVVNGGVPRIANTDVAAINACVRRVVGAAGDGLRVGVLGAGGVARAATYAMARLGADVTVFNRSPGRGEELVSSIAGKVTGNLAARGLAEAEAFEGELVIQCTSVGMRGAAHEGAAPVADVSKWSAHGTVVMETVYRPCETPLIAMAKRAGLRVIGGPSMFVEQAAQQFAMWTGVRPPLELFERLTAEKFAEA